MKKNEERCKECEGKGWTCVETFMGLMQWPKCTACNGKGYIEKVDNWQYAVGYYAPYIPIFTSYARTIPMTKLQFMWHRFLLFLKHPLSFKKRLWHFDFIEEDE